MIPSLVPHSRNFTPTYTHTHTHTLPAHLTIRACPSSFARFLPLLQLDNCFTAQALCCVAFLKPRIEKQHRASQACFSPLPRYFLRLARPIPRTRSGALGFVCRHHGQQDHSKTRSRTHSLTHSLAHIVFELCVFHGDLCACCTVGVSKAVASASRTNRHRS